MITEKQIEEVAKKHSANASGDYIAATEAEEGFKAGAHWAIQEFLKDLWHPISERPDNEALLVKLKSGRYFVTSYSMFVKEEGEIWCYLKDILPKQEGGNNE